MPQRITIDIEPTDEAGKETRTDVLRVMKMTTKAENCPPSEATQALIQCARIATGKMIEMHDPKCDCDELRFYKQFVEAVDGMYKKVFSKIGN